ncbi:MAG: hypothetical protein SGPRY_011611, partial [Prymnesium sp.]
MPSLRLLPILGLPSDMWEQTCSFSLLLAVSVGVYWLMRSLKDSVFAATVGLEYQPYAKMCTLLVVTLILCIYDCLVSQLDRVQLFS